MPDKINTGGGMANEGNINAGNDFIGRDYNDTRWEDRQGSAASNVNVNFGENSGPKRQGESTANWMERALLGDERMQQPGLIEELRSLSRKLAAYIEQDATWKRNTEARIMELERTRQTAISQPVAFLLLALCAMCVIVAIMLINYFGGGVG